MAGGHAIVNTLYNMWLIATLVASTTVPSNAHNLIMAARKTNQQMAAKPSAGKKRPRN